MSVCGESGEEVVEEEFESEDDADRYLFVRRDQSVPKPPVSPLCKKHENENAENKLKKYSKKHENENVQKKKLKKNSKKHENENAENKLKEKSKKHENENVQKKKLKKNSKKHENEIAEKKKIGGSNSRCGKENRVIQQIWSHRTGIQLLKCAAEWGKIHDMNQFRDFVNRSLKANFRSGQVKSKLQHYKISYKSMCNNGGPKTPEQQEIYPLVKLITGDRTCLADYPIEELLQEVQRRNYVCSTCFTPYCMSNCEISETKKLNKKLKKRQRG